MSRPTVRTLLRATVPTLAPTATLADAEAILRSGDWEAVAVVQRGRLLGLVVADDLAAARPSAATTLTVSEIRGALMRIPIHRVMRHDVPTIVPDTPVTEAARLLRDGSPPLPVLDRGQLVGLVGVADVLIVLDRLE
jgi:CBS domain-containing protein